ncbi:AraC family transcriptional regulator [Paractinoplanes abujensis]|uniref:AraC-like DNA-binding protein n=1 Tax=Paractinoplanes abujensis TaxID=882441 RepID=A0A7W7CRX5_9ACTN|nr:helix-turn-helix domain-containing protein [Actinoplanes abujensis]MBB4692163.1 AraC-like DNA-binding protein [Actinoplanes abujensis]GID16422.1 AraC family transcriptional regulator [Actinoplanes abujensis]
MPAILNPGRGRRKFDFRAPAAAPGLSPYVEHYWIVSWDLRGQEPYEQRVLPYPAVNVTFKPGRCRVAGVITGPFHEVLEGAGRVFGVRFRPGGFRPFLSAPVATITGRYVPVATVFGDDLAARILGADDRDAVREMDAFLSARAPGQPSPAAELTAAVVARAAEDTGITRVDDLAREFAVSVRHLQRLFAEYVGVSPKWVIRRARLHEASDRIQAGTSVDLGALAAELGYSDQAHLTRDFTSMVGLPPASYRKAQDQN